MADALILEFKAKTDDLDKRLNVMIAAMERLDSAASKAGNGISTALDKAAPKSAALEKGIVGTNIALDRTGKTGKKAVEDVDTAINKTAVDANKLGKNIESVGASSQKAASVSKKAAADMGSQFKNLGTQIAAAFGLTMGVSAFVGAIKGAIRITADFEAQMSKVSAISGATAGDMDKLTKSAKALGASTIFTATQVGQLQEEYARLGFTTKEILQATEATLDLAAATGETLAASAQVAGATVRGFGLDASETTRVADVMALSFSKSALNLSDFAEAMKLVAPIARAANIPLETATALLGKLADSGLRGSIAGTALKNLLSKLADGNSDLSKELGFSVKNTEDLYKAFQILAKGHIDLTKATELTDERSKAAFITLLNGIDSVESLKTALDGAAGSAKAMADIMQDNFQGAVTELTSAWEGFIRAVTNTSALEDATRAVTRFLQSMTGDIEESNKAFNESRTEVLEYKEALMGLSGTAILKAINDQRDALADAENALSDLRKSRRNYSTGKEFLDAIEAQELKVDTLRLKFEAARKALQDFRDRQTELGGDLAPTADEIERLTQALDEMAEAVSPPVRSIALLNEELKLLKDELTNAEIGSTAFFEAGAKIEAKAKEIEAALRSLRLASVENAGLTLLNPKAINELAGVSLKSLNDALAKAKKNKDEAFEFGGNLKKAEADIAALEKRIKSFNDEVIVGGYNVRTNVLENVQAQAQADIDARDENLANAQMFFQSIQNINNAITSAVMAGHEQERISLDNQLEAGQISREQYDQRRRQLEREKAQDAKTAAIFNAVIGTALAVVNALAVGPPQGYILAALSAALGAVEIGVISAQPLPQFAKGVIGLKGEGTETSDSIHARLSKGESVMTAKETRQHRPILEAIRKGTLEKLIAETYVRPAVDAAMFSGFADIGRSADLNGLTAKLSDHNIIAAMDRNRSATVYGLKMLADKLDKRTPKRGGYA